MIALFDGWSGPFLSLSFLMTLVNSDYESEPSLFHPFAHTCLAFWMYGCFKKTGKPVDETVQHTEMNTMPSSLSAF